MPETIESFVAKLQSEGVEAGRREAARIREAANQEAEQILKQARAEGERLIADAGREAESILTRGRTELELAARDVVLSLRDALNRVLESVLAHAAREALSDPDLVRHLLSSLVVKYAEADIKGGDMMRIDLEPEMKQKVVAWAMAEIGRLHREDARFSLDLQGRLKQAGFTYEVAGGTVEVTESAAAERLMELVGPYLQQTIDNALSGKQASA